MIIFPAIDIRNGHCVRLVKGDFNQETLYAQDPSTMAEKWTAAGAEFIHVVDLDGALAGNSQNIGAISKILSKTKVPVQVGGGIRTIANIEKLLELGVTRVILGSVAVKNPALVQEACIKFPGKIVVGIDAKNGIVAVEGWGVSGHMSAIDLAKSMAQAGVEHIVFTDIARDGMLQGVNVEATADLAEKSGVKVIASGGVAGLQDLIKLKDYQQAGIEGCIIGKALYTGAIDLATAIKLAKEA